MQIKTASLIVNPCDDEYDNMALLCCHGANGELFSLSRFPDEDEVEISVGDDDALTVTQLNVTFSATHLLVEIDPESASQLGHDRFEILHDTDKSEWPEVQETLRIILDNVGTYVCEVD